MGRCYYKILGVSREASQEEIRSAFRRQALRSHPDHHPEDPRAGERFKCVHEAYETLIDPLRRALYDRSRRKTRRPRRSGGSRKNGSVRRDAGNGNGNRNGAAAWSAAEEVLKDLFGARSRPDVFIARRNDLRFDLQVSREDVSGGIIELIRYSRVVYCSACKNGGRRNGSSPCRVCEGVGELEETATIEVTIPPGCREGTRVRIRGAGDQPTPGAPAGDLVVLVHVVEL